jgi:hypothetical protein
LAEKNRMAAKKKTAGKPKAAPRLRPQAMGAEPSRPAEEPAGTSGLAPLPVIVAFALLAVGALLATAPAALAPLLSKGAAFWDRPLVPGGMGLKYLFVLDPARVPGVYLQLLGLGVLVWALWGRSARKTGLLDKAATGAEFALALLLLHFLAAYLVIAARRIGYVYELEFMEGTQVDMVRRVLNGQGLYVEPSPDYVSVVYTPLYYYLGALVSKVWGVGLVQLRCISLASVLGIFALLFMWLKRETGQILPGLIAVGLFAGCFAFSGYWYDIARVDSLSVFCTLLGAWAVRFAGRRRDFVLAGVILFLAAMVKQSAAVVIPFLLLYLAVTNRPGLKAVAGTGALLGLVAGVAMHLGSGGWSTYYLLSLPGKWVVSNPGGLSLLAHMKTEMLPALLAALAGLAVLWTDKARRDRALFYTLFFAAICYTVHKGLTIQGAWLNHLMLFHAPLALLAGLSFHAARSLSWGAPLRLALAGLLLAQAGRCLYDPQRAIPDGSARYGWDKLIKDVKAVEGDVLMPFHGYLPSLAGKKDTAFVLYANAILMYLPPSDPVSARLNNELLARIRDKSYAAIVMDGYGWVNLTGTIEQYYDGVDYAGPRPPVTGWQVAPNRWYTPKPEAKAKAGR